MQAIQLHTQRLTLRSVTPALIHDFFDTKQKDAIIDFFGFDQAGYQKLEQMHEKGMETHRISLHYFLMVNHEDNRPIGECGFHSWNKTHDRAEIFYNLRADSDKRKGYVTEALPAVLDFGFREMGLNRIEAFVANWNIPSVKLLQRFRFTKEGTLREHYFENGKHEDSDYYSLLKREWNT